MRRMMLVVGSVVVAVVLVSAASGSAGSGQTRWVIRDLGTLGGKYSQAVSINERGQVLGLSRIATGARHLFLWADGRTTDLGPYGGDGWLAGGYYGGDGWLAGLNDRGDVLFTEVFVREGRRETSIWRRGVRTSLDLFSGSAMNDHGQIVGSIRAAASSESHAAVWENGRVYDLGVLPGHRESGGAAINSDGAVLGVSGRRNEIETRHPSRVFLWQKGKMRGLPVLRGFAPAETDCVPVAINDRRQALGYCTSPFRLRGVLWEDGRMRDLTDAGGFPDPLNLWDSIGIPLFLNERGQIVGQANDTAWFWQNGTLTFLDTLGGRGVYPTGVNDKGQVVGESRTKTRALHAFVWENGTMTDLGTLPGGRYSHALAINNHGQIVGYSVESGYNAPAHAVLWTLRSG